MKKFVKLFLISMLVFVLCSFVGLSVTAFAEESTGESETTTPTTEESTATETEVNATLIGRIWEYLQTNYNDIATTAGNIVLLVVVWVKDIKSKKKLANISTQSTFTANAQSDVVDVVNKLIENYNDLEKKLESYNNAEDKKYEAVGSMVVQTKAILEILSRVYSNSKNLPQGVKDLVNLTYANALKITGDTEQLKAEVESATEQSEATTVTDVNLAEV